MAGERNTFVGAQVHSCMWSSDESGSSDITISTFSNPVTSALTSTLSPYLKALGFTKVTSRKFARERNEVIQQLWVDANEGKDFTGTAIEKDRDGSLLGYKLDEDYAQFLRYANGWPAFYQSVRLFGTEELLGNAAMENALRTVSYLEEDVLQTSGVDRAMLLPIAATDVDMDIFVLDRTGLPARARVIWFAGTEIQRFGSFSDYFLAMVDYNRAELAELKKR